MAPLDQDGLRRVAAAGRYAVIGPGDQDVATIMGDSTTPHDSKAGDSELDSEQWLERRPWLVVALLPMATLAFRRGRARCDNHQRDARGRTSRTRADCQHHATDCETRGPTPG